jgi:hypothetical protein
MDLDTRAAIARRSASWPICVRTEAQLLSSCQNKSKNRCPTSMSLANFSRSPFLWY